MRVRTAQAVLAFVCVTFAVLIGRLAYIQAKMRPALLAYSEARQTGVIPIPGCRGIILDSRKRVLAGSQQRPTIYADPTLIEDHAQAAATLSGILHMPATQLRSLLDKPASYVELVKEATPAQVDAVKAIQPALKGVGVKEERSGSTVRRVIYADPSEVVDLERTAAALAGPLGVPPESLMKSLDKRSEYVVLLRGATDQQVKALKDIKPPVAGLGIQHEPWRVYPMKGLGAHVVGCVGADGRGLEGIELAADKYLRDKPGRRKVYYDALRRPLFQAADSYTPPRDGLHVMLTIDSAIQETTERELSAAVDKFQAENGLAIVMDPNTGAVLALTCYPSFSPEGANDAPAEKRRNRILTDPAEPGSIFKPFVMAAALEAGVTNPNDVIFCHNGLYITGRRQLKDHRAYGNLTSTEIISHSSNIGMAILGQRLGNRRMYESLHKQGFGQKTGIDLPGEGVGLFMPLRRWGSYTTTSVPMGHELAVTPIQIITAFAALSNGGRLLQPRVVSKVIDQEGHIVEDRSEPIDKGQVVDAHVCDLLREMMIAVVVDGTAKAAALDRWTMMGKTGTAQVPRRDRRGYEEGAYLSSFVAAAPATNPRLVGLVMIRKPNRRIAYYGSTVSAPVIKAIFEQTLSYLNVPPDREPPPDKTKIAMKKQP